MMRTSYTSETPAELKLLSVSTSAAGMLCLSLSNLLPWSIFLMMAGIHLAVLIRYYDRELIGTGSSLAIMAAVVISEAWRISLSGGDAVVPALRDIILALAMTRLVMRKTPREMYQMVGISFSQCMLATIFTVSPLFLIGLAFMILLVPMTLYALDAHSFSPSSSRFKKEPIHWITVSLGIVLTAIMLFYILPRPASSIIRHTFVKKNQFTFTENVDLNTSGRTSNDSSIVMRIIWSSKSAPAMIYLAGARLEGISPDGFSKQEHVISDAPVARRFTDRLIVYPAALQSENVFYPFWFHDIAPRKFLFRGTNLYWSTEPPPRYDLWVSRIPEPSPPGQTYVPDGLLPVTEIGLRIAGQGDPGTKAERLARYLRTQYRYSLDHQEIPPDRHGIEWFMLSGRTGTCEHFASALAVMLRGCDIPARVVTGFLVTEYNETGNYYIVRASDAHAWVEYWDGSWHTIDATPAGRAAPGMRFHVLDELRFRWTRWVIEYSLDDQIHLAFRIASTAPRITGQINHIASYSLALMGIGASLFVIVLLVRRSMLSPYDKVRRAFRHRGIHLPANSAHEEHLTLVHEKNPALAAEFRMYLDDYLAWRFGEKKLNMREKTTILLEAINNSPRSRMR